MNASIGSDSPALRLSNKIIVSKYFWMCRQLRYFNDAGSIVNWAHAMSLVKNLLLEPLPVAPAPVMPQPPSSCPSYRKIFSTNIPSRTQPDRSISTPTTICFYPTKFKPLTLSPASCSNSIPSKSTPLTIYTHCQPEFSPTNSLTQCPKRRKLTIPPSVDCIASAKHNTISNCVSHPNPAVVSTNTPTRITSSATKIAPGMHIW